MFRSARLVVAMALGLTVVGGLLPTSVSAQRGRLRALRRSRAAAAVFPFPSGPALLPGPMAYAPFGPFSLFGYGPLYPVIRQPVGHEITRTGPNGYTYRPIYDDEQDPGMAAPLDPNGSDPNGSDPSQGELLPAGEPVPADDFRGESLDVDAEMSAAVDALGGKRYPQAIVHLERIVDADPGNGFAFALFGLAQFCQEDFFAAAELVHRALANLPREQWGDEVREFRNYLPSNAEFTRHLRGLEQFVREHPQQSEVRFLLGYYYGYLGYAEESVQQLRSAIELFQLDPIAPELLEDVQEEPRPADDPEFQDPRQADPARRPGRAQPAARGPREF